MGSEPTTTTAQITAKMYGQGNQPANEGVKKSAIVPARTIRIKRLGRTTLPLAVLVR